MMSEHALIVSAGAVTLSAFLESLMATWCVDYVVSVPFCLLFTCFVETFPSSLRQVIQLALA